MNNTPDFLCEYSVKPVPQTEAPTYSVIMYPTKELPSQYESMLFSRWMRSLRFGNQLFKRLPSDEFYKQYKVFLENLLAKPDSQVRVAVLSDDKDVVLGFSVSREDVLDYVHVHTDFRRLGIGRKLVPEGITTFTHMTAPALIIWQNNEKYKPWKFNPFA